ncbi:hypothetical protein DFJ74DRAFT_768501 [Hyaloraphidium curvatum]|nr:hypothetical protein DFJ74DRAFT_768501 [Hyaloraphidium curvatum]
MSSTERQPAPATNPITPPVDVRATAAQRVQLLKEHLSINAGAEPKPWDAYEQKWKLTVTPWADEALTKEERDYYDANGYVVKRGLCSKEECERWAARFRDYASGKLAPAPGMNVMRDLAYIKRIKRGELPPEMMTSEAAIYKINDFQNDPHFFDWTAHPNVARVARAFCGPNVKSLDNMLVYVELEPGDAVFFHPYLVHGSGLNKTQNFRKALTTHYTAAENHFVDLRTHPNGRQANMQIASDFVALSKDAAYKDAYATMNPDERDELMVLGQILNWKSRSRLVCGETKGW